MRIFHFSSAAAALLVAMTGCGDGKTHPKTTEVTGSVTLDGKALAEGEVSFVVPGEAPALIPIKDGNFKGKAFAGTNRVELRATKTLPKPANALPTDEAPKVNLIPDKYNVQSKLEANVTAGGQNSFNFEASSK